MSIPAIIPSSPNRQAPASGGSARSPGKTLSSDRIATPANQLIERGEGFLNYIIDESHKFSSQDEEQIKFLVRVFDELNTDYRSFKKLENDGGNLTPEEEKFMACYETVEARLVTRIYPDHETRETAASRLEAMEAERREAKISKFQNSIESLNLTTAKR